MRKDLAELLATCGIAPATPHAGRHGLASYWLDGGVPASVVAERLGHADPGITQRFYSHASADGHARADDLAAQLLPEQPSGGVSDDVSETLSTTLGDAAG